MTKPESIGKYIEQLVDEQNLSKTDFAKKINTTKQNVAQIFNRTSIDSELLLTICRALNKNVFAYYNDEEPIATFHKEEEDKWKEKLQASEDKISRLESDIVQKTALIEELNGRIKNQEDVIRLLKEKEEFLKK